ncbi:GIY-YIG nuclease family protein [bacterium]|nr:GIY-YIG nuclease family protein [bacterium]
MIWNVYILRCADGTLYTGITNNLNRRVARHNQGNASKYTRTRRPVCLIYVELQPDRTAAARREIEIKSWPRARKEAFLCNSKKLSSPALKKGD